MKIWKEIAFLAPLIIIAGLLKQIIYYAFFNIPIVHFIELNEVPVLFSEDILHIIILLVIMLFVGHLGSTTKTNIKLRRFNIGYYRENELFLRAIKYVSGNYINLFGLVFILVLLVSKYFENHEMRVTTKYLLIIDTAFFIIRFGFLEVKRGLYLKKELEKKNENIELGFSLFVLAINLILIFSVQEVERVKYGHKYSNVNIVTDAEILSSDSMYFYIGRTKNYVFFHDLKSDMSRVIPSNRVQEMNFGEIIRPLWHKNKQGNKLKDEISGGNNEVVDSSFIEVKPDSLCDDEIIFK